MAERGQAPRLLEEMVLERLQAGEWTYDRTILEAVYAWRNHESAVELADPPVPYRHTRRLIDALFRYTDERPMLHATLSSINGEILHELGQIEAAASAYLDAVDELHGMHLTVDTKRIHSMTTLGHLLLSIGNKPDAEKLFLDVLSYPWYLVTEAELMSLLRESYITAGLGLIECRRGNLAGLREIFFVPAAEDELLPTLKAAIEEARRGPR
jgi:hypothetical protein